MRRNLVIPILGGVIAALLVVVVVLLLGRNHKTAAITQLSPAPSGTAVATATPLPTPAVTLAITTPAPKVARADTPEPAAPARATPAPTAHPVRAVSSVNCSNSSDAKYCSAKDSAFDEQSSINSPKNPPPPNYPGYPTISMTSSWGQGKGGVTKLHIVVTIENKTSSTFHFPDREIELVMTKDGEFYRAPATHGPEFDMAPKESMTATFDIDTPEFGSYEWQARTWYW